MSKYFIDTEFIEKPGSIQLISIGITCDDGREYYAVSKDFNLKKAWNEYDIVKKRRFQTDNSEYTEKEYWLRENVLKQVYESLLKLDGLSLGESKKAYFSRYMLKFYLKKYGKTNKQIADDIKRFIYYETSNEIGYNSGDNLTLKNIQFYGYYCDYDWVVFCWLFGKMIDLPKGFPEYCRDLKQMYDETSHECSLNLGQWGKELKKHPGYPKQENGHNALDDARWNKKLYNFLKQWK